MSNSILFPLFLRYLTGMVDKRTLEKYEREAKEKNRETWYELTEDHSLLFSLCCDEYGKLFFSLGPYGTGFLLEWVSCAGEGTSCFPPLPF